MTRTSADAIVVEWAGQQWELLADRAVHWPARATLIVADIHFGKAAAFRHHGVPVPSGSTVHDLQRLSALLRRHGCQRLVILGDFLHARDGRADATMRLIGQWRAAHGSIAMTLVRGNHDHNAGDPPPQWNIACVDELDVDGVTLRHTPDMPPTRPAHPVIAGHVHPCVRLHDIDGSSIRAPCFVFSRRSATALLPAFGTFTGAHPIRAREGDRVFAVGSGEVIEVAGVCV